MASKLPKEDITVIGRILNDLIYVKRGGDSDSCYRG